MTEFATPSTLEPPVPDSVILDTTTLVADWRLQSAPTLELLRLSRLGLICLVVPEVVIQETANKYEEVLRRAIGHAKKARDELRRLGEADRSLGFPVIDPQEYRANYETHLRDRLWRSRASVAPIPSTGHEPLVSRALERKKPFSAGGAGYRDALIWVTVLDACKTSDRVVLVTANSRDFAADAENMTLAPELAEEVRLHGLDDAAVTLRRNPADYVTHTSFPQPDPHIEVTLTMRHDAIASLLRQQVIEEAMSRPKKFTFRRHQRTPGSPYLQYSKLLAVEASETPVALSIDATQSGDAGSISAIVFGETAPLTVSFSFQYPPQPPASWTESLLLGVSAELTLSETEGSLRTRVLWVAG